MSSVITHICMTCTVAAAIALARGPDHLKLRTIVSRAGTRVAGCLDIELLRAAQKIISQRSLPNPASVDLRGDVPVNIQYVSGGTLCNPFFVWRKGGLVMSCCCFF